MKKRKNQKNLKRNTDRFKKQPADYFYGIYTYFFHYPTSSNLSTNWNWGFLAFFFLMLQIVTGILLSTHYVPTTEEAFLSVNKTIMRDVPNGNMLRYFHSNGASFFFAMVYLHIARSFFYKSYVGSKRNTWLVGVLIYLLMCFTAFTGYVLPWGQMSYWAAIVITSLTSAAPVIGPYINTWVWGNFSVNSETLHRFFSLHYAAPFLILLLVFIHVILLHQKGSSNRLKLFFQATDKVTFARFFILKDLLSLSAILGVFFMWVAWIPNALGHPDNYVPANPAVTPEHIVPEWYFLPYYAMLRSVPNKVLGIIILLCAIAILFIFPFFIKKKFIFNFVKRWDKIVENYFISTPKKKRKTFKNFFFTIWDYRMAYFFWIFFFNFILLGRIGAKPVEYPYDKVGLGLTILYFLYFFVLITFFEEKVIDETERAYKINVHQVRKEKLQEISLSEEGFDLRDVKAGRVVVVEAEVYRNEKKL